MGVILYMTGKASVQRTRPGLESMKERVELSGGSLPLFQTGPRAPQSRPCGPFPSTPQGPPLAFTNSQGGCHPSKSPRILSTSGSMDLRMSPTRDSTQRGPFLSKFLFFKEGLLGYRVYAQPPNYALGAVGEPEHKIDSDRLIRSINPISGSDP